MKQLLFNIWFCYLPTYSVQLSVTGIQSIESPSQFISGKHSMSSIILGVIWIFVLRHMLSVTTHKSHKVTISRSGFTAQWATDLNDWLFAAFGNPGASVAAKCGRLACNPTSASRYLSPRFTPHAKTHGVPKVDQGGIFYSLPCLRHVKSSKKGCYYSIILVTTVLK